MAGCPWVVGKCCPWLSRVGLVPLFEFLAPFFLPAVFPTKGGEVGSLRAGHDVCFGSLPIAHEHTAPQKDYPAHAQKPNRFGTGVRSCFLNKTLREGSVFVHCWPPLFESPSRLMRLLLVSCASLIAAEPAGSSNLDSASFQSPLQLPLAALAAPPTSLPIAEYWCLFSRGWGGQYPGPGGGVADYVDGVYAVGRDD